MLKVQVPYPTSDIEAATKKYVDDKIAEALLPKDNIIYGFHINGNESDPSTAVTYLEDAVGMTPCYMNYYNGFFDYGSWEHAFFMPKPCMLKYDGTVDYYLNPNDYSLKEDGTASDIANTSYEGNAMIEWGQNGKKIWYKIVPDTLRQNSASVYIANYKADENYHCWSFIDENGVEKDHFYTGIYNGSNISSKLRSLSGQTHMVNQTGNTEFTYAQNNGSGWTLDTFSDRLLINFLLILIGKSLDTQKIFGNGHYSGGTSASSNLPTGLMDSKGMFWGTNDNTGVKVFGMENWWAEVWRRILGLIGDRGTYKYKLTPPYNFTAEGYTSFGTAAPSASQSYISAMSFNNDVMLPTTASGSSTTYYCDGMWGDNGQVDIPFCGGSSVHSALSGAFSFNNSNSVGEHWWNTGGVVCFR